jgi:hypothetical protein
MPPIPYIMYGFICPKAPKLANGFGYYTPPAPAAPVDAAVVLVAAVAPAAPVAPATPPAPGI